MSYIVVDELVSTLSQTITLEHSRIYHVAGIKIKVLMYNSPAGTFTLSIKQGATTLASQSFTSADIKTDLSTTDDYAYLYKALNFSLPLKKGDYILELSASGYTYSQSSFLGWIKSHENVFIPSTTSIANIKDKALDVLIYEKLRGDLTR